MGIKISVIVPVYNTQDYLKKCLESIVNQTLTDIEIIVVNDGSTDKSLDILKNYQFKYDNIIIINKQNEGQGAARNKALEICKGDFIAFVDSDDYIEENMLESMFSKSLESDLDVVVCNYKYVNNTEQERKNDNSPVLDEQEIISNVECIKRFLVTETIEGFSWNKLFKRELFNINNIRYPEGMKYEDIPTIVSLLINAKKIGFINSKLYNYVTRENSTTSSQNIQNIRDYIKANCMVGKILEYNDITLKNEYEFFYSKRVVNIVYGTIKICKRKDESIKFANDMLENINKVNKFRIFWSNKYFKKIDAVKILIKIYLYKKYVHRNIVNE